MRKHRANVGYTQPVFLCTAGKEASATPVVGGQALTVRQSFPAGQALTVRQGAVRKRAKKRDVRPIVSRQASRQICRQFSLRYDGQADAEFAHELRVARLAIARVLAEWSPDKGRAALPLPKSVDALVRYHCADYDRRRRVLEGKSGGSQSIPTSAAISASAGSEADSSADGVIGKSASEERPSATRRGKKPDLHRLRLRAKSKQYSPAPLLNGYRRLNALIDCALDESCDAGIRDAMRRDIAERRGDRRTALYFMDRRTYLRNKRKAKLALAAALELL